MTEIVLVLKVIGIAVGLSLLTAGAVVLACFLWKLSARKIMATRAESRDLSARWNACLKGMVTHDERAAFEKGIREMREQVTGSHSREQAAQLRLLDLAREVKQVMEVAEDNNYRIAEEDLNDLLSHARADLGVMLLVQMDEEMQENLRA